MTVDPTGSRVFKMIWAMVSEPPVFTPQRNAGRSRSRDDAAPERGQHEVAARQGHHERSEQVGEEAEEHEAHDGLDGVEGPSGPDDEQQQDGVHDDRLQADRQAEPGTGGKLLEDGREAREAAGGEAVSTLNISTANAATAHPNMTIGMSRTSCDWIIFLISILLDTPDFLSPSRSECAHRPTFSSRSAGPAPPSRACQKGRTLMAR